MRSIWGRTLIAMAAFWGDHAAAAPPLVNRAADQLRAALPGYQVNIADDLTIRLRPPGGGKVQQLQINLDRISNYCAAQPEDCDAKLAEFVTNIAATERQDIDAPPSLSQLRLVVRPGDYAAEITKLTRSGGDDVVSRPFAAGLVMFCYLDTPTAMRPVRTGEIARLNLKPDQALAACLANTRAALPRIPTQPPRAGSPDQGVIGQLEDDPYASSYLLFHDDWAPLAGAMGGHLLVVAPDQNLVFYTQDKGPAAVDALGSLARDAYAKAQRPISPQVFRWTASGWEIASP